MKKLRIGSVKFQRGKDCNGWQAAFLGGWLCLMLIWGASSSAKAEPHLAFDHYFFEEGLSNGTVFALHQDQRGFLWLATQQGVNRFDGYTFKVYKHDPANPHSLSENDTGVIVEDQEGFLWIGTWGGGLNRFDPQSEHFKTFQHNPQVPNSLSDNRIQALYVDHQNTLWIGTFSGGLQRWNPSTQNFTTFRNDPQKPGSLSHNRIWTIQEDAQGRLWVGTHNGLNRLDPGKKEFVHYFAEKGNPHALSHSRVRDLMIGTDGHLWIGTQNGLNRFDAASERFTRVIETKSEEGLENVITHMLEDSKGFLWYGTTAKGLFRYDLKTGDLQNYLYDRHHPKSLSHNNVRSLLEDRAGNLWIGTRGGGLNKLDLKPRKFETLYNPESKLNNIFSIYEDAQGEIWMGVDNAGVYHLKTTENTLEHAPDLPEISALRYGVIRAILGDSAGGLWIGTLNDGLFYWDRQQQRAEQFSPQQSPPQKILHNTVRTLAWDQEGNLWIGTDGGLNRWSPATQTMLAYTSNSALPNSLSGNQISTILQDTSGRLWVGTDGDGLNRFDPERQSFTSFRQQREDAESLSNNRVTTLYQDQAGRLWIGTEGGLNRWQPETQSFVRYLAQDNLPTQVIVGILEDEHNQLWLSSYQGIIRFNPEQPGFRQYDSADGMQGNLYNRNAAFRGTNGAFYFGGVNGLTRFFPQNVRDNPHVPRLVITEFRRMEKSMILPQAITTLKEIELSYRDNYISFEFAALDFTFPAKNQYAYRMEGLDEDWIYSSNRRFVTYTNLEGGTYRFRVKGSNNDGVWNEKGIELAIRVVPPWWKRWWAYLGYSLGALVLIRAYISWKSRLQQRELALQKSMHESASRFVPYEFLEFLEKSSLLEVKLGDQVQRTMTILVSDIRDFTPMSERMHPEKTFAFVNDYFGVMSPCVRRNQGFIDKYLGDGMMALFRYPEDALSAAIEMLEELQHFNERRPENERIKIGIGLNTGSLMLGTVGEHNRMECTVISDAVNLAVRTEALTKTYGTSLLISENTRQSLQELERYTMRFVDHVVVKGKSTPVNVFEVFNADPPLLKEQKIVTREQLEEAIVLVHQGEFAQAQHLLQQCLEASPHDQLIQVYRNRCRQALHPS